MDGEWRIIAEKECDGLESAEGIRYGGRSQIGEAIRHVGKKKRKKWQEQYNNQRETAKTII